MTSQRQWPSTEPAGEEPAEDGDLEEVPESDPHSAGAAVPAAPTAADQAAHLLTHLPFQAWCELCVAGEAKEDHHRTGGSG